MQNGVTETYNLGDKTLTLTGNRSNILVENGGALVFNGNELRVAPTDIPQFTGSIAVQIINNGTANFNNATTYIGGFNSTGLGLNSGGVMTANNLIVDIDRSAVDYRDIYIDDYMSLHAVNVQGGSSLTVYGAADIKITGNDGNDMDTTGLRVMGGSTVALKEGGTIAASGAQTENNGLVLDGDANDFISDKAVNISATGES